MSFVKRIIVQGIGRPLKGIVQNGPFKGMRYPPHEKRGSYPPKLLGAYEAELRPTMAELKNDYELFVNIGAADGYYAVGVPWLLKGLKTVVFELDEGQHGLIRELASINGVKDIEILGTCTKDELLKCVKAGKRQLIIIDVEGAEGDILGESVAPLLTNSDILVEIHEFAMPGVGEAIRKRFEKSHDIVKIATVDTPRRAFLTEQRRLIGILPNALIEKLLTEYRPCRMEWFWIKSGNPA